MTLFKVFVYAMAGLGAVTVLSVLAVGVGKAIALGNRTIPERTAPVRVKPTLTVVWRDTDVMLCAFTGKVEFVGDYHMRITDDRGFCEMVDRRDVEYVY